MKPTKNLVLDTLASALHRQASSQRFLVGLSGGLDSVVLLHALTKLRAASSRELALRAIHVNHGLHPEADNWARFCEDLSGRLEVLCETAKVSIPPGASIESAAREARYAEFERALAEGEELLLAHHRDDQMETLLLRLLRGSGSRGLSGIPESRDIGRGRLLRPLLAIDREALMGYAESEGLDWVQDESNADQRFDRNYLRHAVLPLLEARWPAYRESWTKSATLATESETLLTDLAEIDLRAAVTESPAVLHLVNLLELSEPRRRNVLRHWYSTICGAELSWNDLSGIAKALVASEGGCYKTAGFQVHSFRDRLYLLDGSLLEESPVDSNDVALGELKRAERVSLANNGCLRIQTTNEGGLAEHALAALTLRYRQGGESCKLHARPNKSLKKVLQESGVPPWLRDRQPLLFCGDDLACVPGIGVCEAFVARSGEAAFRIDWERPDLRFGTESSAISS